MHILHETYEFAHIKQHVYYVFLECTSNETS